LYGLKGDLRQMEGQQLTAINTSTCGGLETITVVFDKEARTGDGPGAT
jgi:hypothetical protein